MPFPRFTARRVLIVLAVCASVLAVALIGLIAWARPRLEGWARDAVVRTLERRLDSEVQLGRLEIRPGPVTYIAGGPLTIRHRSHLDKAPLIHLERFETSIGWRALVRAPRRIDEVALTGLAVVLPPSRAEGEPRLPGLDAGGSGGGGRVVIDRITAASASLTILPRELRKLPRIFGLQSLTLRGVSGDEAMAFDAVVVNPQPRGRIETAGTLGPWVSGEPAQTPLRANYRFKDGDLSTIRGIAGRLESTGTYAGVLERIEAIGTTTVPEFDLTVGGKPLPLSASFTVVVDGTNGNTYIQPAEAMLGAGTPIRVTGGVVKAEDRRGRTVDLAATITKGRLEDALALVVYGTPAVRGRLDVVAALIIPPGPEKVVERMRLDGRFTIAQASFRSAAVQAKLDELSRRAQGRQGDPDVTHVRSAFSGRFHMADGVIRFPALAFDVEGARVQLAGTYAVRTKALDFSGRIRLVAGVSRIVGGKKGLLLRPFDGLFKRNGRTEFPIWIRGSVDDPKFGVDFKTTLRRALLPGE